MKTIEQVRDWHRKRAKDLVKNGADPMKLRAVRLHQESADAIDAHLDRQSEGVSEDDVRKALERFTAIRGEAPLESMRAALTAVWHNRPAQEKAEPVDFSLPQDFVQRVTTSTEDEPPCMGAGHVDSIRLIAEEMVSACKAERQGDAEFTHDAVDDWAHRLMCFASYTTPPAERVRVPDDAEAVSACLGDDAAAMLETNAEDERALNMQRAAQIIDSMLSAAPEASIDVAEDQQWTKDQAKLHERKTVHEWLNELHIEQFEFGKPICLLRRLRILCDKYFEACEQLSFEIRKQVGLVNVEEGDPRDWIDISVSRPERNQPTIYWHKSESGGFAAIADEWRDEHHLAHASHWMPYVKPIRGAK